MAIDETEFRPGDTDNNLLRKILMTLLAGGGTTGGGSSGGAVTIAEGADVTEGSTTDPATALAEDGTVISQLKGVIQRLLTAESLLSAIDADIGNSNTALGAPGDAAVTNPASSASIIAALKGILTGTNLNQNVGGYTVSLKDTTAVSTSAYTAGDAVGAKRTITGALRISNGSGVLQSITILDRSNQKAALEVFIFDSDPAAATITDNAAFVFSTDDLKVLAHVTIAAADYITVNSKAVATIDGIGVTLKGANANTSLFAAVVAVGTPTYAATTDVQLIYGILQD